MYQDIRSLLRSPSTKGSAFLQAAVGGVLVASRSLGPRAFALSRDRARNRERPQEGFGLPSSPQLSEPWMHRASPVPC